MNWYSFLLNTKIFSPFGSRAYKPFQNWLNFTIFFGMWTNNASYCFGSIVTRNFPVVYFILMIFVMKFLLDQTSLMCGMSHFWCYFIGPPFVLMPNGLSKSCMFDTYFELQKTVSVESLPNRIISFMLTSCANEQFSPAQKITRYSLLLDKILPLVFLSSSFLECTCFWALSFGILSLVMQSGYFCPIFPHQLLLPFISANNSVVVSSPYLSFLFLFPFGCL